MTDPERYEDPALARRVRSWVKDAAPTTAPERLVFAVMDEVERDRPSRGGVLARIRLRGLWQYVALSVAIAIGVAVGTFATRQDSIGSRAPSPAATDGPSGQSPSQVTAPPSLPTIDRYNFTRDPGPSAIGISGSSLWVGRPDGSIVELDASTGEELRAVTVGVEPITITPVDGLLWVGSGGNDLIWVDPASGDTGTIAGAGGHYVLPWNRSIWVSRQEEFVQVDLSTRTITASLPVPGHAASDPGVVVRDELWAGAGAEIVRVALPAGTMQGAIRVTPSALVVTDDGILAIDAGVLLRISTSGGVLDPPVALVDGLPRPTGATVAEDRLWITGALEGRAGEVIEIDLTAGRIVSRTPVGGGTRAIAVIDRSVWVAVDNGALLRLIASP